MNILQMSVSASVLIMAIVFLRAIALYKLPKKTFSVLWGVVLCRLLIPFSIPSDLSIYSGLERLRQAATDMADSAGSPDIAGAAAVSETGFIDMGMLTGSGGAATGLHISPLVLIWVLGMAACTGFFLAAYLKCRKEFKTALPCENGFITEWQRKHPLRRPVQIRQSDKIKAPLTYGVFRPVLLLPKATDWTNEATLAVILAHEYVHIKRFDALTKLLLTSALCIHWFNPFTWLMYALANRDIELGCDEAVVRKCGEPMKSAYALTLIGLEEKKSRLTPLCNNFSKNAIEERITAIMKMKKYTLPVIITAVFAVAAVTVGLTTSNNAEAGHTDEPGRVEIMTAASPTPDTDTPDTAAPDTDIMDSTPADTGEEPGSEDIGSGAVPSPDSTPQSPPADDGKTTAEPVSEGGWVWPAEGAGTITSLFGKRFHPISGTYVFSDHIDIAGDEGTSVYAALAGTVSEAGYDAEQGNYVRLFHVDGIETVYRHLDELLVSDGDAVFAGDTLGTVGSTGKVTGPCLSFCVFADGDAVNPLKYYQIEF
jgi:murein DD-endopeptidase MepM/ murein hydrolase activator NlpD